jgi:hypothetical protein
MDPNDREIREILEVVEAAGVAGLCLEGRLEIGLQEARRLRPELALPPRPLLSKPDPGGAGFINGPARG